MKVLVERAALLKSLGRVYRIVERRNTIPILSNVLLRADGDRVTLKATDLDVEVTESLPAQVGRKGATTVAAHVFHDIVRKFPEGSQVDMTLDGPLLVVKAGRSKFSLQVLPEADFPDLAQGEMSHSFTMASTGLAKLLDGTLFAISNDDTRYYLNGVYVHSKEEVIRFVSTDGHRLAKCEAPCPEGAEGMPAIILPKKAAIEVRRLLEGSDEIEVQVSAAKARFDLSGTVLVTKLIDGTYPDYERVIPKGNARALGVDRVAFKEAVDRVSTISSERGRAVKLSMKDGRLELSTNNVDAGSSQEEMEVDYEAAPLEIGFNPKYMLDVVSQLGSESMEMMLDEPGSPAIVREKGASEALYVLMPMRI